MLQPSFILRLARRIACDLEAARHRTKKALANRILRQSMKISVSDLNNALTAVFGTFVNSKHQRRQSSSTRDCIPHYPPPMSAIRVPLSEPRYSTEPVNAQPQIVFTRQLWERTMPATETDDISTSSQGISSISRDQGASRSRRLSSVVPLPPPHPHPSPTLSRISDTPLTPEESPPFHSSRKRSVDALEHDDYPENSPSHTGDNSSDSTPTFCLCQPEPKVPRPRNGESCLQQQQSNV